MRSITAGLIVAVIGVAGVADAAEMARQFSADVVMQAQGKTQRMRIAVDGGKTRSEMILPATADGEAGVNRVIVIARPDLGQFYMVIPGLRTYSEQSLEASKSPLSAATDPTAGAERLDAEMVRGQLCTKYRMTQQGATMLMWVSQANSLPVRMAAGDGSQTMDFDNVQVGPQPASLFEVPSGYAKGVGMEGLLGGAAGGPTSGLSPSQLQGLLNGAGGGGQMPSSDQTPEELMKKIKELTGS